MKKLWLLSSILLLGGCFSHYRKPAEYDLKPVEARFNRPIVFGTFSNLSGADRRMMSRDGSEVNRSEYARWIGTPDVMLLRALSAALPDGVSPEREIVCSLTIYRFGWNENAAQLAAEIVLRGKGKSCRWFFRTEEKCGSSGIDDRLAALDKCVNVLAESIGKEADAFAGGKE